jgi:DNA-binding MarR family transcriptional regulator
MNLLRHFKPRHTLQSVAERIAVGLAAGDVVLRRPEPPVTDGLTESVSTSADRRPLIPFEAEPLVLKILGTLGGPPAAPCTLAVLAASLDLPELSVRWVLDGMERLQLVQRDPCQQRDDGACMMLTPKGRAVADGVAERASRDVLRLLPSLMLNEDDKVQLRTILTKVADRPERPGGVRRSPAMHANASARPDVVQQAQDRGSSEQ